MGFSTVIEQGIVFNTAAEGASLDDFLEYVTANIQDWRTLPVCWDMSKLDYESLTGDTVRNVIYRAGDVASVRAGLKTAFTVDHDLGFGMMRMFQMIADEQLPIEFRVFRDKESAVAWLSE